MEIYKKIKYNENKNKSKNCINIQKIYCSKCFKFLCYKNEKEKHNIININNLIKFVLFIMKKQIFIAKKLKIIILFFVFIIFVIK